MASPLAASRSGFSPRKCFLLLLLFVLTLVYLLSLHRMYFLFTNSWEERSDLNRFNIPQQQQTISKTAQSLEVISFNTNLEGHTVRGKDSKLVHSAALSGKKRKNLHSSEALDKSTRRGNWPIGGDAALTEETESPNILTTTTESRQFVSQHDNKTVDQDFQRRLGCVFKTDEQCILSSRAPNRIPAYIHGTNKAYFGYVFRDLATRVLHVDPLFRPTSAVVVISEDAEDVLEMSNQHLKKNVQESDLVVVEERLRKKIGYTVGGSFILRAAAKGHTVYGVSSSNATNDRLVGILSSDDEMRLLVLDPEIGAEDDLATRISNFLSLAKTDYLVSAFHVDGSQSSGMAVIFQLLNQHYRVQLLSISHLGSGFKWKPNQLITKENVQSFRLWAASLPKNEGEVFRGYFFATKSWDLAIPSRKEIITQLPDQQRVPYLSCSSHSSVHLSFTKHHEIDLKALDVQCGYKMLAYESKVKLVESVWFDGPALAQSEGACLKVDCGNKMMEMACTSRVIPKPRQAGRGGRSNLLMIELDSVSADRFSRYLPQTAEIIEDLGFTSFGNHTALSIDPALNFAALYTGDIHGNSSDKLWKILEERGYATMVATDGCVANQRIEIDPIPMHGNVFDKMFCRDFGRPNCAGSKSASEHLVEYTNDFIERYDRQWAAFLRFTSSREDSFTLTGTLDDSLVDLIVGLNNTRRFGRNMRKETMIVLTSTQGINYGSYTVSPQGKQEIVRPFFHLHLPSDMLVERIALEQTGDLWTTPLDVFKTVWSVIVNPAVPSLVPFSLVENEKRASCVGAGISSDLCKFVEGTNYDEFRQSRMPSPPSIFAAYADVPQERRYRAESCSETLDEFVFPKGRSCRCATNAKKWFKCTVHPWGKQRKRNPEEHFLIVRCGDRMHFETRIKRDHQLIERSRAFLRNPFGEERRESVSGKGNPPNVLFLELDSLSRAHADRVLPRTRELLQLYRVAQEGNGCRSGLCSFDFSHFAVVGANSSPNQVAGLGGCMVSVAREACNAPTLSVGQICTDPTRRENGLQLIGVHRQYTTWCPVNSVPGEPTSEPWLFDVARKAGYLTLFGEEFCYEGSPYCPQDNLYELHADILVHKVFCSMVTKDLSRRNRDSPPAFWESSLDDENQLKMCLLDDQKEIYKSKVVLEHIEQMWDVYPDVPKFAFLNSIVAHSYHPDESKFLSAVEQYDELLSQFLETMIRKGHAGNTIIVIRSDHGLQDGPFRVEYSIQVEALRPWTEILLPANQEGYNMKTLAENQDRLATSFDLYHTLARTIGRWTPHKIATPSGWSFHLGETLVSPSRSCRDARIQGDFCLHEDEHHPSTVSPNFGTCNRGELHQFIFCHIRRHNLRRQLAKRGYDMVRRQMTWKAMDQAIYTQGDTADDARIEPTIWRSIDKLVQQSGSRRVSGGIFLYPRQMSLIRNLVVHLATQMQQLDEGNRDDETPKHLTVCETGFGAGHSAALFLDASEHVVVHSFDLFDRPYQPLIARELNKTYQNRFFAVVGDSCRTVPKSLLFGPELRGPIRCDFLHGSSLCKSDNIDLVEHSPCGVLLTSTAMFSIYDKDVYFGETAQWRNLVERGCIKDIACFQEIPTSVNGNYVFAGNGTQMKSQFCVAVTTGTCQRGLVGSNQSGSCLDKIARITQDLDVVNLAKRFQIPIEYFSDSGKQPRKSTVSQSLKSFNRGILKKISQLRVFEKS